MRRQIVRRLLVVVVALVVAGAAEAGRKFVWVRVASANLRSGPSVHSEVVDRAPFGTRLLATGEGEDWLRVERADGRKAFIYEELVTDDHPGRVWVDDDFAALRTAPDSRARVVTTLDRGSELECLGKGDDWYKVRAGDGTVGWIADDAVDDDPPDTLFVRVASATLHAEPRGDAEPVAEVAAGATLEEIEKRFDFYHVRLAGGPEGWVYRLAVTEDVPFTVFVDAEQGKVRTGRLPGAEVVETVPSGSELVAFDEDDDWFFVRTAAGNLGWISGDEALAMGGT